MSEDAAAAIARVHREEWARVVAALARRFGGLGVAEDAAAEAFVVALERWPADGVPANPAAWVMLTAQRRALDRLRRESVRPVKERAALDLVDDDPGPPLGPVADDRLRLMFTCCHPALAPEARVALTLRLVAGLGVAEIARAFLVPEATMAQRITRAKAKVRAAHIPYRVPQAPDLGDRLDVVLAVLFVVFNEGHLPSAGEQVVRADLCDEAIRLARLVCALLPEEGEPAGLLALLLMTHARRAARITPEGALVAMAEQDRQQWDAEMIAEGHALVAERVRLAATRSITPGRFQLLASISAVHTFAPTAADVDWASVVTLYDQLLRLDPNPVVRLNRAVALAEAEGPAAGLAAVEELAEGLAGYHAWHVAHGELLTRLGRRAEAHGAFERALGLAGNAGEREHLTRRIAGLHA